MIIINAIDFCIVGFYFSEATKGADTKYCQLTFWSCKKKCACAFLIKHLLDNLQITQTQTVEIGWQVLFSTFDDSD